jgi:diguanylate cyclase (GGDEF)-like protein
LLACALACVFIAIVVLGRLQADATAARDAELALSTIRVDLLQMRDVPWGAFPDEGGDPEEVRGELRGVQTKIETSFAQLSREPGLPQADGIMKPFRRTTAALWDLFDAAREGNHEVAGEASGVAAEQMYAVDDALKAAAKEYRADSARAIAVVRAGSVGIILLLFGAFAWFYGSAVKRQRTAAALAAENQRLLAASQEEALTDSLTSLGNRRALLNDLQASVPGLNGTPLMLALFDLDGFKQYNDSFGHPAGDALLSRLGERLATTMAGIGSAYRIGGDEFCVVASADPAASDAIAGLAASALSDVGEIGTPGSPSHTERSASVGASRAARIAG